MARALPRSGPRRTIPDRDGLAAALSIFDGYLLRQRQEALHGLDASGRVARRRPIISGLA